MSQATARNIETSEIVISPMTTYTGAEIFGADLSKPLDDQTYKTIRDALNKWGVIFFRDQDLTPEQYIEFGSRFGEISPSKSTPVVEGYPLINSLVRKPEDERVVGEIWHIDQAYRQNPTFGTILYGKVIPPYGGDTSFINMGKAFDALSDGLKDTLRGLNGVNVHNHNQKIKPLGRSAEELAARQHNIAVHPVVLKHPETGEEILYVNPGYTERFEGWTEQESAPLLKYLFDHSLQPEFLCRFRWQKNSIAFWDNRHVWHYVSNDTKGMHRVMHRLVVG